MANVRNLVSSRDAEKGFYPTPSTLVEKMIGLVDWNYVDSILEPSAGKGDLALPAAKKWLSTHRIWGEPEKNLSRVDLDCVEIDPNLRAILKDKGLRVVHDDFLTFETRKRYSLILMNPPFEDGDRHLLKAISLLAPGGQLVCLLNAETVRNPYSVSRKNLVDVLGDAKIDYIQDAFKGSERSTGVETVMVVYRKPEAKNESSFIMDRFRPAHEYVDRPDGEETAVTKENFIEALVDRYNYEVECGCALIDEYRALSRLLSADVNKDASYQGCGLTLAVDDKMGIGINGFVRFTRRKYWSALFGSKQFVNQLTTNLRDDLYRRLDDFTNYEFSAYNIYELLIQLNSQLTNGVEQTIMDLFDDWTRKYHWDENASNRHYFDGWRTNDAFAVNKKVIIPMYIWDGIFGKFDYWKIREKLDDVEKVMNYLDGCRTPETKSVWEILQEAQKNGQSKKIETKYFYVTLFKKGTVHLEFRNPDLLAKFNIFAARGKNWLPPSFGRKKYAEMDPEEQKVAASFMGDARKYDAVVEHAEFFLDGGNSLLSLTA